MMSLASKEVVSHMWKILFATHANKNEVAADDGKVSPRAANAEILGDPYSKKSMLPSIGNSPLSGRLP